MMSIQIIKQIMQTTNLKIANMNFFMNKFNFL